MTFEFTNGFVLDAEIRTVGLVGGVIAPPGVVPAGVIGGAVGDSLLQPARIRTSATIANVSFRFLISIIETPVNSYIHPRERLSASTAREAEIECHSRTAADALTSQRCSEYFQDEVHCDDGPARLRIASAVLRQKRGKRRLIECSGIERLEAGRSGSRPDVNQ